MGLNCFTNDLEMASEQLLKQHGIVGGCGGYHNLKHPEQCFAIIFDDSVKELKDSITGANQEEKHFMHYNMYRDDKKAMKYVKFADIHQEAEKKECKTVFAEAHLWKEPVPL